MKTKLILIIFLFFAVYGQSQNPFPNNGISDEKTNIYAFTNATIFVDYQTKIENATLVVEKNKIKAVGKSVNIPKNAVVVDLKGKFIYPSFIDPYTTYGFSSPKRNRFNWNDPEKIPAQKKGAFYINDAIKADFTASKNFKKNTQQAKSWRDIGFGSVLSFNPDGLARGSSVLVSLSDEKENYLIIKDKAAAHYSFKKGSSKQMYPISIMGFVATIRQAYYDAIWYKNTKPFYDETLEAWNNLQSLPQIFEANSLLNIFRADKIGDEFGVQYIIKGSGEEYQRIEEIKKANVPLIIPVNFPEKYNVQDVYDSKNISLKQMKHWELAPTNPAVLSKNNITFAFTYYGIKSKKDFISNIRKAIKHGLSEKEALKALTFTPAKLLKADNKLGSLKTGYIANFIITSKPVFEKEATIHENWIQGKPFIIQDRDVSTISGKFNLQVDNKTYSLEITEKNEIPSLQVSDNGKKLKTHGKINKGLITLSFESDTGNNNQLIRLSGWIKGKSLQGQGELANGKWIKWSARHIEDLNKKEENNNQTTKTSDDIGEVIYPFVAYGNAKLPEQETLLFKNATVWTNEKEGILKETDVLVKGGKIVKVGKNLSAGGAKTIDATGKHLTSGIIDEHSHIALSGINDIATVSAMVRMQDAVDPTDVNIYRQLSGGVTASQLLHGSANPVGGQSAMVKLRWGKSAEEMLVKNADGFIKFALGENVKRSYSATSIRFPQTRMGVEQVYMDAFTRAKEYQAKKNKSGSFRKDLMLETMLEILNKKRFITCHSYVQSEINMLMKVAEKFDFKINTFTHILEGYKVADKMKKHGVGGSSFADWWAYKFEVYEAIPYNAAIMHNQGVLVAINSDDAEMARRLNQEAAKIVKYGKVSEEEAWKMVTLNPAKLLHLDDRMGSVKVGKDADLVLWSDNPLSIYAKAEKTLVDGIVYFDLAQDKKLREYIRKEKARLIQKMKNTKGNGIGKKPMPSKKHHFHCDDLVHH